MTANKESAEEKAWGVDSVFISNEGFVDKGKTEKTLALLARTFKEIKYQQEKLKRMWREPLSSYKNNCGYQEELTVDSFLMLRRLISFHLGHSRLFHLYYVLDSILPFVKDEWGIIFTEDGNVRVVNCAFFNAWQGGDMKREILLFRKTDEIITAGAESLLYQADCACKDIGIEKQNNSR